METCRQFLVRQITGLSAPPGCQGQSGNTVEQRACLLLKDGPFFNPPFEKAPMVSQRRV